MPSGRKVCQVRVASPVHPTTVDGNEGYEVNGRYPCSSRLHAPHVYRLPQTIEGNRNVGGGHGVTMPLLMGCPLVT